VTACPFCGEPPQAITTNDATGASVYMDEEGHTWQDPDDTSGPVDDGNPDGSALPVAAVAGRAPDGPQPEQDAQSCEYPARDPAVPDAKLPQAGPGRCRYPG
jgi:hypothetical protein